MRSPRLRIALVAPRYLPHVGGVEVHVAQLAAHLARMGDAVDVLTHEPDRRLPRGETAGGVTVRRFPIVGSQNYALSPRLWAYLRDGGERYDIVHAHSYHATAALAAGWLARAPFVFTPHYHGTGHSPFRAWLHRLYRPAGRSLVARADAVICVTQAEAALLTSHFRHAAGRVVTIPNGVDTETPRSTQARSTAHPVVLAAGRLERYKNTHLVLAALPYLDRATRVVVIGDGPERAALGAQARRLGVADRVRLLGIRPADEARAWLATADVVACLSAHEAFGMVPLEALTTGTPVVASDIPAHRELAGFATGGGLDLVDAAMPPPELAGRLSEAIRSGRVPPARAHDWAWVAARTREVYRAVLDRPS